VSGGVPGHVQNLRLDRAELHDIVLTHAHVHAGDRVRAFPLAARTHHDAPVPRFQLGVAAGVIGVPVRVEDVRQLPPGLAQRSLDRGHLGGVHHRGRSRRRVVQQERVVV
jgi:hypothetical protein